LNKNLKLYVIFQIGVSNENLIFHYFIYSLAYKRPGGGSMTPEDIDPCLCTHVIYAFSEMENNLLIPTEKHDLKDNNQPGRREILILIYIYILFNYK